MVVALTVFGPNPKATMVIPNPFSDFVLFLTASESDGYPSVNVKKISGCFACNVENILS